MAKYLDLHSFLEKKGLYSIASRVPDTVVKSDFPTFVSSIEMRRQNPRQNTEANIQTDIAILLKKYPVYTVDLNVNTIDIQISKGSTVYAIFEVKKINSGEMVTNGNLNKKALHELIVNFALLDQDRKADNVKWLIATDGINWIAFLGDSLRRAFLNDNNFMTVVGLRRNLFALDNVRKSLIYDAIKRYIEDYPQILNGVEYIYFTISNNRFVEDASIFLSPDIILMEYIPNVGNTLNPEFYKELLYIMGLKENSEHKIESANVPGSFFEQIINHLEGKGLSEEEKKEKALELLIIWFNRILFLKLFESRLISFNDNDYTYSFMNIEKIPDFPTLKRLFFDVLASPENSRPSSANIFNNVPYLNSSLFEEKEIEHLVSISELANDNIQYYETTVLKDNNNRRRTGETRLLNYLFEFLGAYDFGSSKEGLSDLISPAVLGLIFEKINGYKDGSYYTPNEITDYMAETAIKDYLVRTANKRYGTDYKEFNSLLNAAFKIDEIKNAVTEILDEIKICDPAVGSGHFLVSALNVLLELRWRLGILKGNADSSLFLSNGFEIERTNGDIIFKKNNKPFVYKKTAVNHNNVSSGSTNISIDQIFQETIFETKKFIIENNLFGVDINPKSVEIARLRLWIELLKNAYYKKDGKMETLPNIDINIQKGDSLLSVIVDVTSGNFASTNIPYYKQLISQYQNADTKSNKLQIKQQLEQTRNSLLDPIDADYREFVWTIDFPQILDSQGNLIGFDIIIGNPPYGIRYRENKVKRFIQSNYNCARTINNAQRGTHDSFALFIEQGVKLLNKNTGVLIYIVPISFISSESMTALHNYLKSTCAEMWVSSYAVRPQPVFESAVVNTSIVKIFKCASQTFKVFTTKMNRKSDSNKLTDILSNLQFIEVSPFYINGRYPKISYPIEYEILTKIKKQNTTIRDLRRATGKPIFYRSAGGRYFKIVTPYSTNSSAERIIYFDHDIADVIGAFMSSNLFFWFYQIYSDNLNLKLMDIDDFGIPLDKLDSNAKAQITNIYPQYLNDIESNAITHSSTNYAHVHSYKEYKIRKSKGFIDAIDDVIGPLYDLTKEEIEFIKNYEIKYRMSEEDDE